LKNTKLLLLFNSAHSGATVNQLLRRAAAAAAMRRERNSSCHSDDLQNMKRHRPDSGMMGPNINNNNLDIINHMPQITATDFSTNIKHINNISPHIKDTDRMDVKTPNGEFRWWSFIKLFDLKPKNLLRKQQQHVEHKQQRSEQQQQ
jgi:hypothetical protein